MTLLYLVLFSGVAIALLALALHLSGKTITHHFEDEKEVEQIFLSDFPEVKIVEIILTERKTAAVLKINDGQEIGIAHAMGTFASLRKLDAAGVKTCTLSGGTLTVKLNDFSDPRVKLIFSDIKTAEHIETWFSYMMENAHA